MGIPETPEERREREAMLAELAHVARLMMMFYGYALIEVDTRDRGQRSSEDK